MDLHAEATRRSIWLLSHWLLSHWLLSHFGSHPNIFFTKDTWIKPEAEGLLLASFRWSPEELAHMLRAVRHSDYGQGTLGECLDVLLYEDPNIVGKLHFAITLLLKDPDHTQAARAATLALTHSKDQRKELALIISDFPVLMEHEWLQGIAKAIEESPERFELY